MRRAAAVVAALSLGLVLAPGCGDDTEQFPTGTWVTVEPNYVGDVGVLDFSDDGTWTLSGGMTLDDQQQVDWGTYSTSDDTFTWETDELCKSEGAEQGTYTWELDDDQLILTVVSDECAQRVDVATAGPWARPDDLPSS
jgi:hypothetical protein